MNNKFGKLLLNDRIITKEQLDESIEYHKKKSCRIGEAMLDLGYINDEQLSKYLKTQKALRLKN